MKLFSQRKGFQISEVPTLAIVLGVIFIVMGVMAMILTQIKTTDTMTSTASRQDANTVNINDKTYLTFGDQDTKGNDAVSCANTTVYNGTNAANVTVDYTVSGCTVKQTGVTKVPANTTGQSVQYLLTFKTYTVAYNATERGEAAQDTLSSWGNTWAVIIAAAVVVGIIGAYMMFKPKE